MGENGIRERVLDLFEEKKDKMNYWNQKMLSTKGQTMTIHLPSGTTLTNVVIDSIDLVKELVYFRPNNGKGALSYVPWKIAAFIGADHDPTTLNMDISKLAEEV